MKTRSKNTMSNQGSGPTPRKARRLSNTNASAGSVASTDTELSGLITLSIEYTNRRDELLRRYDSIITGQTIRDVNVLIDIWGLLPPPLKECDEGRAVAQSLNVLSQQSSDIVRRRQNLQEDSFPILFTGETSSGKSTLINLIIGEDVMPVHTLPCTPVICHIREDTRRRVVIWYNNNKLVDKIIVKEKLKDIFDEYVKLDLHERTKKSCDLVELYWPMENLKGVITLVDSPGISDDKMINQRVLQYLPNAVAFVYVINSSNAGGIDDDRIGLIWSAQENLDYSRTINANYSIVVCNKWDLIKDVDKPDVRGYIRHKLDTNIHLKNIDDSHIIELSAEHATTDEFYKQSYMRFMDILTGIMKESIPHKLERHKMLLDGIEEDKTKLQEKMSRMIDEASKSTWSEIETKEEHLIQISIALNYLDQRIEIDIVGLLDDFTAELRSKLTSPNYIDDAVSEIDTQFRLVSFTDLVMAKDEAHRLISSYLKQSVKKWTKENCQTLLIDALRRKINAIVDIQNSISPIPYFTIAIKPYMLRIPPMCERHNLFWKSVDFITLGYISRRQKEQDLKDLNTIYKRQGYLKEWMGEACNSIRMDELKDDVSEKYKDVLMEYVNVIREQLLREKEQMLAQLTELKKLITQFKNYQHRINAVVNVLSRI